MTWGYCAECSFVVSGVLTRALPYLKTYRVCAKLRVGYGMAGRVLTNSN